MYIHNRIQQFHSDIYPRTMNTNVYSRGSQLRINLPTALLTTPNQEHLEMSGDIFDCYSWRLLLVSSK